MMKKYLVRLLVLSGFTLLCSLGGWQLSRGQQKQALIHAQQTLTQQAPLSAALLQQHKMPARFTPVAFAALVLNQYTILLDNKTNNGKAGYHVYVPAVLNDNTLILINRGWVSLGTSRANLPPIPPLIGVVPIEGYLDFAYRNRFVGTTLETTTLHWPLRVQQIDIPLFSQLIGKKVYPMLVNLNSNSPYAFALPAQPQLGMSPSRHYGYALQWFALAITLLVVYIFARSRNT